ncbi:kinesin-like protein KIN-7E isoform X2 [Mangifera indica]|uniref:kinesin-like protein KIN-7E isoform X2 n=1 Tax=Mangifera indica TaxID=29780 RepID=UPI001CF95221|nr:kinesin-like protein KIN-7E isoform X2 [Mangifera indica]
MGAVSGEEVMKMEKMQMPNSHEEKILVLVRLRPLSEKEVVANEVVDWECINDTTILYRNTLREGSTFPSAYTFDRVFHDDCPTKQVYEDGAKSIALSVVSGINTSIFAYGQTSSGKTYTMTGITEHTVADIFDYIHGHEERAFVLKFSAIEIYNESIRDLLGNDNASLRLLDDPERGTILEKVTEQTLKDWNHLKELLSACEAQRRIGETLLNEKSSRSHQIIRLTIESSAREFLGKENSTTLSASVNFIDLAGSERASQALSTGARLKEGCHINRSLLTLSTVIRKLSKGRHGHINYRDSKLTRLLQPCLGGNARTAIICTLSPARSHIEQTRNTLLFACCAKEVTTKAQVNVVMSDKALVKHLQKELARLESELRSPAPISSSCDLPALLRKKDLQIQKMEKEIKELTKQRDLAQSRVEDLLRMVVHDQDMRQEAAINHHPKHQVDGTREDSISESSGVAYLNHMDVGAKRSNGTHYYDTESGSNSDDLYHQENTESHSFSDCTSSPLLIEKNFVRSHSGNVLDENANITLEDSDEYCKEVQCIEMERTTGDKNESRRLSNTDNEGLLALTYENGDATGQEITSNAALKQRLNNVQKTIDSLISHPDLSEKSPMSLAADMSSSRNLTLMRSWSCRANLMADSSTPGLKNGEQIESTPPNGMERNFLGRPEGFRRKLLRNDSSSSLETASIKTSADEDITSIHTFVAGLKKMAKNQVQETGLKADDFEKNVKDVGLDPMHEALATDDWPLVFESQQRAIFELWQSCNVSLIHRTYFFLLFKGDPSDSVYMEVEHRRLSFLKETFSQGNQALVDGRTLTFGSSLKALCCERETLSKLMRKRLSEEERTKLFERWNIRLDSKRRRLQLANLLWSDTKDMNHVKESAAVVAMLIRFVEQGQAVKEMAGLSFTPPVTRRRSIVWKNRMASLL